MRNEPVRLPVPVTRWREDLLRRAGCSGDVARHLANDVALDATALVRLMRRGCPPRLAARILAPLDRPVA